MLFNMLLKEVQSAHKIKYTKCRKSCCLPARTALHSEAAAVDGAVNAHAREL